MIKKVIKIAVVSVLGFIVVIIFILYSFAKGMCGYEVVGKYISPDKKHTVDYFIKDCGVATGFVNNIEIDGKLILRAEPNNGESAPFKIVWDNNEKLSIRVATNTTSFRTYNKLLNNYKNIEIKLDQKIIDSYRANGIHIR